MVSIKLCHGDAFQSAVLGQVDHIITDPPYTAHVQANMRFGHSVRKNGEARVDICKQVEAGFASLEDVTGLLPLFSCARRWIVAFCALEQLQAYSQLPGWLRSGIYRKQRAMPQFSGDRPAGSCEGIAILHGTAKKKWNGGGTHAFWEAMPEHRRVTMHPTAKPVELCIRLVRLFTDPGDTILDPFMGTGSIGIACRLLGRNYIGIELQEDHVNNAENRIREPLPRYLKFLTTEEIADYDKRSDSDSISRCCVDDLHVRDLRDPALDFACVEMMPVTEGKP